MRIISKFSGKIAFPVVFLLALGIIGAGIFYNTPQGEAITPFQVRADGDDTLCTGRFDGPATTAPNCAFRTIQKAVDSIQPGDDIIVHAGTYPAFELRGTLGAASGRTAGTFQATAADPTVIYGDPTVSRDAIIIDPGSLGAAIYSYGGSGSSSRTKFVTIQHFHIKGGTNSAVQLMGEHNDIVLQDIQMDNFQSLGVSATGVTPSCSSGCTPKGGRHDGTFRDAAIYVNQANNITIQDINIVGGPYYCATAQSGGTLCGVDANAISFNGGGTSAIRRVDASNFLGSFLIRAPQGGVVENNTVRNFGCDSDDGCIQLYNVVGSVIRYNVFANTTPLNNVFGVIRIRRTSACTARPNGPSMQVYNNTFIGNSAFGNAGSKKAIDVAQPTECNASAGAGCASNPPAPASCSNISLIPYGEIIITNNIVTQNYGAASAAGAINAGYCSNPPNQFVFDYNLYYGNNNNYTAGHSQCNSLYGPFETHGKININPQLDPVTFAPAVGSPACSGGNSIFAPFIGAKPCSGSSNPPPTQQPVCGNGIVETGEQCDGVNLAGSSCISRGFTGGTLGCTASCLFNTNACTSGSSTPPPTSDTTPPSRSSGQPTGTLTAGTTQATLSLATNENATCKYSTVANVAYNSIANTFATTGGTTHTKSVGVTNGGNYSYYVRCRDVAGNANTNDFTISFSVASVSNPPPPPTTGDTTPPIVSGGQPSGQVPAEGVGTTQVILKVATNENATCKYGSTANTSYVSIVNTFASTGGINHANVLTVNKGNGYHFYVRCRDTVGNVNATDYPINFSIAAGGVVNTPPPVVVDTQAPTVPTGLTANVTSPTTVNLVWNASSDNVRVTGYNILRSSVSGGSYVNIGTSVATNYGDSGLTASTNYYYVVRAYDAARNTSGNSMQASARTSAPPPGANNRFAIGDRVRLNAYENVRQTPDSQQILGTQSPSTLGRIIAGPQSYLGYVWWKVDYDRSPDGWSREVRFDRVGGSTDAAPGFFSAMVNFFGMALSNIFSVFSH